MAVDFGRHDVVFAPSSLMWPSSFGDLLPESWLLLETIFKLLLQHNEGSYCRYNIVLLANISSSQN